MDAQGIMELTYIRGYHKRNSNFREGFAVASTLVQLRGDFSDLCWLSWYEYMLGEYTHSYSSIKKALTLNPNNDSARRFARDLEIHLGITDANLGAEATSTPKERGLLAESRLQDMSALEPNRALIARIANEKLATRHKASQSAMNNTQSLASPSTTNLWIKVTQNDTFVVMLGDKVLAHFNSWEEAARFKYGRQEPKH